MIRYSVIIPVYNRPEEVKELLDSLSAVERSDWEIIIVEDGSSKTCEDEIEEYINQLPLHYYQKENTGQGFTRNWAAEKAQGEFLVFLDSDCLVPSNYFDIVDEFLRDNNTDSWGGPDRAHRSFTDLQKAVGFTMSSFLTTGGIRGQKKHFGKFQPRSFNMGVRREAFLQVKGFYQTNLGEDIEFSTRFRNCGYKSSLIKDAFVYHKRRETVDKFVRQAFNFGRGRVINARQNKGAFKVVHLLPLMFTLGFLSIPFWYLIHPLLVIYAFLLYIIYFLLIGFFAILEYKSLKIGILSIPIAFIQLSSYALGMVFEWVKKSK